MKLKIIGTIAILLVSVITLGCVESSSPDSSSLPQNAVTPTPTPTSIITSTPTPTVPTSTATPLPSPIESSIVLVIDASGSTAGEDPTKGFSFIGLIDANALNLVQKIGRKNHVGVVSFGGTTKKTDILSLCSETNRAQLEKFIRDTGPSGGDNPTDLDKGLRAADELLNSVNGTKKIIVLSDGMMPREGFDQIKKIVVDLKNKDIKIHFLQVRLSFEPTKEPNRLYNELAQISGGQAMVLNPDERINVLFESAVESDESC
ncbi:MAG: vWA domain-containing protein [Candidatus Methanoperedens sp.]